MRAHVHEFRLVAMCRVLGVHRSGYYAWLHERSSVRQREDERLQGRIKHASLASGTVYGTARSRWTCAGLAKRAAVIACVGS